MLDRVNTPLHSALAVCVLHSRCSATRLLCHLFPARQRASRYFIRLYVEMPAIMVKTFFM